MGAGRRRIDNRVTARAMASARTARPTICAPTTGMPSGRIDEFAASWPLRAFWPGWGEGRPVVGLMVGNRPDALPPGDIEPPTPPSEGRPVTGSEEVPVGRGGGDGGGVDGPGVGAPTETEMAAAGSLIRLAPVALAVSVTELTEVAFRATEIPA